MRRDWSAWEVWGSRLVLSLTTIWLVVPAVAWANGIPPLGDDSSSHIVMLARVAEAWRTGAGWWAPDFNLGFPIGLYYQPLPHFVAGTATAMAGGAEAAIGVYKISAVVALGLFPWGVAFGARQLGLRPAAAAAAGVAAPLVVSVLDFGLTVRSSLILGLFTQAWAAPLLPVALGLVARVLRGDSRAWPWAVAAWATLCLTHFFYGVAVGAAAALWALTLSPPEQPSRWRERFGKLARQCGRLVVLGLLVGTSLLFWLVPLFSTSHALGGWPFGSAMRRDGYGFEGFSSPLLEGALLDGEGWPVLTLLTAVGLVLCFAHCQPAALSAGQRFRRAVVTLVALAVIGALLSAAGINVPVAFGVVAAIATVAVLLVPMAPTPPHRAARLLLGLFILAGLFSIGRAGLGVWVDVFYFNRSVQMFRYIGLFHLACVWLIGWGVHVLLAHLPRTLTAQAVVALLAGAVLWPAVRQAADEVATAYRTIDDVDVDVPAYLALTDVMRAETASHGAGRIFAHPNSGLYGHYHGGLLALWDASDAGESYGVGLHDSLNFYYLEFFHPEDATDHTLLDLYGFQYIAGNALVDFSQAGAERVYDGPRYNYWRMPHRVSLCQPVHVASRVEGTPRAVRQTVRAWLNGDGPGRNAHLLLDIPEGVDVGDSTTAPVQVDNRLDVPAPSRPPGRLILDQRAPDRHACRVDMNRPGAVLLKVGYHPYWRATVNGDPVPVEYATPAFMAVELPRGTHDVIFEYRLPGYVHPLLALGLCIPFVTAFWVGRKPREVAENGLRRDHGGRGAHGDEDTECGLLGSDSRAD